MRISNSQIMDWQKCQRRFYYAQILKLRPKTYPGALKRGLDGHELFEAFFNKALEGGSYEECVEATNEIIERFVSDGALDSMGIYRHVLAFGAKFFEMPWKVVSVEVNYIRKNVTYEPFFGERLDFAFTPDLIAEWTEGPKRGQQFMLDFKFTGQYWNEGEIAVYQQVPKYIRQYNKMHGTNIFSGAVVQLNTRASNTATGQQLYRISWLKITTQKLDRIEAENLRLMQDIATAKLTYSPKAYVRTVDTYQCKMCFFAGDLCPMELEGRDPKRVIERNYVVNTYFEDNYGPEDSGGPEVDPAA